MTISKHMLLALLALAMVGVGVAMYLGLQLGLAAGGAEPVNLAPLAASAPIESCEPPAVVAAAEDHGPDRDGGDRQGYNEVGDFATNSGTIADSQFSDGGFGDIGQQWWNVEVNAPVTNVHISGGGTSVVNIGQVDLGSDLGEADLVDDPASTTTTLPEASTTSTSAPSTTSTSTTSTTSTTVPAPGGGG